VRTCECYEAVRAEYEHLLPDLWQSETQLLSEAALHTFLRSSADVQEARNTHGWQALLVGASWMLIGSIVWSLFVGRVEYPTVLGALLQAAVAGVLTHVPAGLGVLEAVFVATLAHALPATEALATVLAYRAADYLLPLALALPAYAWSEAGAPPRALAARRLKPGPQTASRAGRADLEHGSRVHEPPEPA